MRKYINIVTSQHLTENVDNEKWVADVFAVRGAKKVKVTFNPAEDESVDSEYTIVFPNGKEYSIQLFYGEYLPVRHFYTNGELTSIKHLLEDCTSIHTAIKTIVNDSKLDD